MRKRSKTQHATGIAALAAASTLMATVAQSSELDVCVDVLQDITGIAEEYRCGSLLSIPPDTICLINPTCCVPQVCKVTPGCGVAKTVVKTITAKGDVHCFEDISAEELWQRWRDKQIAFTLSALTGFTAEALLVLYKAEVELIAARGDAIPDNIQALLRQLVDPVYNHGVDAFSYGDIENVKIVNESYDSDTDFFLTDGKSGITLGPVMILKDEQFNALKDMRDDLSLAELLVDDDRDDFQRAMALLIHEMVHVQQYRELGQDAFTLNYLMKNAPLVTDGYGGDSFEREAYNFTAAIVERWGGELCEANRNNLDSQNTRYDLGRSPVECRPFTGFGWMAPIFYRPSR
jgi:hypothetical protein